MSARTTKDVLLLYKDLLKYGRSLTLTDKDYFIKRIKTEFRNNKHLRTGKEVEFQYNRGKELLKLRRVV